LLASLLARNMACTVVLLSSDDSLGGLGRAYACPNLQRKRSQINLSTVDATSFDIGVDVSDDLLGAELILCFPARPGYLEGRRIDDLP
jgi:hypothetical protein